jgi:hypothetical protein
MSDVADLDQTLTVGDDTYTVRFTHGALVHAEKLTGKSVPHLAMAVGVALVNQDFSFDLTSKLACAGLEGARRKHQMGGKRWTPDATEDLLDDAQDFVSVADPVYSAFDAAVQRWFPEWADNLDESDPTRAAGAGTGSTPPDSEQDSPTETSGD